MHRRHNSLMSSTAYSASATPSMTKCFRWSVIALIGIMLAGGIGCAPNDTETQRDATLRAASTSATTGGEPLQTSSPGSADTDTQRDPSPEATAISTTTSGESSQTPPPASDSYSDFGGSGGTTIDVSHVDAGHYAISVVIAGNDRRLASDAWKLEIFRRPGDELVFEGAGRGVAASWRGEMLIEDASWNLWIRLDVGDDASWRVMLERIGDLPPPSSQPDPTPVSTTTPPPTLTPTPTAVAPTPTPTPTDGRSAHADTDTDPDGCRAYTDPDADPDGRSAHNADRDSCRAYTDPDANPHGRSAHAYCDASPDGRSSHTDARGNRHGTVPANERGRPLGPRTLGYQRKRQDHLC